MELKPCPFCGYEHPTMTYSGYSGTYTVKCPNCQINFEHDCTAGKDRSKEKTAEAWNRRANVEPIQGNSKSEINLDGKCGSCEHSVAAVGYFGNSACYVECKNPELQATRRRQEHPFTAIRARTTKGCKHYKRRADHA